MSEYFANVVWSKAKDEKYTDNKYSRAHQWVFDGGATVEASSSPHIVPLPYSIEANVDPEEAFVASLASCHMLFFLSIAAKQQFVVNSYIDQAVGTLQKDTHGKLSMTQVILRPQVIFSADKSPAADQLEHMHHEAHDLCFIANSVTTKIIVEVRL